MDNPNVLSARSVADCLLALIIALVLVQRLEGVLCFMTNDFTLAEMTSLLEAEAI